MGKNHTFTYRNVTFDYEVIVSKRRRTIGLEVHRDQRVVIRVPKGTPQQQVEAVVAEKANWIVKKLGRFAENPPLPARQYQDGEIYQLLGEEYVLVVKQGKQARVVKQDQNFILTVPDPDDIEQKTMTFKLWYRLQAITVFEERLAKCHPMVEHLNVPYPDVYVREMKTRWGSCSGRSDRINLNTKLVQLPLELIDYVIVHELCHFVEHNHSSNYYAVLTSVMPDWSARRERLKHVRVH